MHEQQFAAIEHRDANAVGQVDQAAQDQLADRAARCGEARGHRGFVGRIRLELGGVDRGQRDVARAAHAARALALQALPHLERLIAAEQQVPGYEDVGNRVTVELLEYRVQRLQVAVDIG